MKFRIFDTNLHLPLTNQNWILRLMITKLKYSVLKSFGMIDKRMIETVVAPVSTCVETSTAVSDNRQPALSKALQDFWFFFDVNQSVTIAPTLLVKPKLQN